MFISNQPGTLSISVYSVNIGTTKLYLLDQALTIGLEPKSGWLVPLVSFVILITRHIRLGGSLTNPHGPNRPVAGDTSRPC